MSVTVSERCGLVLAGLALGVEQGQACRLRMGPGSDAGDRPRLAGALAARPDLREESCGCARRRAADVVFLDVLAQGLAGHGTARHVQQVGTASRDLAQDRVDPAGAGDVLDVIAAR